VLAERLRIAREMHDVLAHSVMVLQSGAARMALHDASPDVRALLAQLEGVGRDALDELRGILGLLRGTDPASRDDLAPPQGDLAALISTMRAAGLPLTVHGLDLIAALPDALSLTVFRVVQEGLTSALKHAGAAPTTVTFANGNGRLTATITDSGGGTPEPSLPTGGHALTGLRERVQIVGGTLTSGPTPHGGWQLRAELAISQPALTTADAR